MLFVNLRIFKFEKVEKMKCGVILPLNEMRDEITKNYFY